LDESIPQLVKLYKDQELKAKSKSSSLEVVEVRATLLFRLIMAFKRASGRELQVIARMSDGKFNRAMPYALEKFKFSIQRNRSEGVYQCILPDINQGKIIQENL